MKQSTFAPEHQDDQANWVVNGCSGPLWSLSRTVPIGFEEYLRILHPGWRWPPIDRTEAEALSVDDFEERKRSESVCWAYVAAEGGKVLSRTSQWHSIAPIAPDTRKGEGGITPPYEGEMPSEVLSAVFELLTHASGADQECVCAFWEGFGQFEETDAIRIDGMGQGPHFLMSARLGELHNYWESVLECYESDPALAPQAFWPRSRDWFFAIPYEMHSSFFGGPKAIADQLLDSTALETFQVLESDKIFG